ncbi:TM2 domain-containing protein [Bifidobacterium actinocoloniiforme DSM 22766]|uniref:TM2 domain-containing protein n=1 Tax=Bifidobacterium actinocoloniiforme DSM 22766 TaxID=1437605 RepID=A0A086YZD9_9BIFI|nr:TM2 domain-containing protein [Bifidobacterium actinocoloniiforme DSM 22766]
MPNMPSATTRPSPRLAAAPSTQANTTENDSDAVAASYGADQEGLAGPGFQAPAYAPSSSSREPTEWPQQGVQSPWAPSAPAQQSQSAPSAQAGPSAGYSANADVQPRHPEALQPGFAQPGSSQPAYGQPSVNQPAYAPAYGRPGYAPQPSYPQGVPSPAAGQGWSPYVQEQPRQSHSKLVAGVLGIFLGVFGLQNFYLGNTGRGVAQLMISCVGVFFFFSGPIVSCAWGILEGILILISKPGSRRHQDAYGVELID